MQFRANQSFIAQVLCENKNKPEMHCNGMCHLKKELDRDTQQEKNNNTGKDKYEVMFVDALYIFDTVPPADQIAFTVFYKDPHPDTFVLSIFHPPQPTVA
jgi:hypothetical protein